MRRLTRTLSAIHDRAFAILVPAEGEEWLVLLAAGLLLLGAARHRVEPWLQGLATGPPPEVASALAEIDTASFGRVDLNRAGAAELETLPRIGPALAARILADRSERGPFRSVDDLDRVQGIGPATIAALRHEAFVDLEVASPAIEGEPGAAGRLE